MLPRCENAGFVVSRTRTAFLVFVRFPAWSASSATLERAWSRLSGAQKNGLRSLWADAVRLLRSPRSPGPRSSVRRPADLPADRGAPCRVPALWPGEARAPGLPGREFPLHEAVRVLRRQALPVLETRIPEEPEFHRFSLCADVRCCYLHPAYPEWDRRRARP